MIMRRLSQKHFDVVLVLPHLLHLPTGGDREITKLVRRLVKDGYKVGVIYLRNPEKHLAKFVDSDDLKSFLYKRPLIHSLYYNLLSTYFGFYLVIPLVRKLMGIDFREDYSGANLFFEKDLDMEIDTDTIIAQSWEASYFVDRATVAGKKYYRLHHNVDNPSFSGDLHRLASSSFTLPMRKIVENDIVEERFRLEDPIRIHIGIDLDQYRCMVLPEKRSKVVLFPLRRNESKGAKYALEAIHLINEYDPDVKIMGFGNYPKEKIPDFMEFKGTVSNEKLVGLYNEASITVIPSIVEGTSLPAIEAMSCGSALASTDNEGISSIVSNEESALLFRPKDSKAIFNAVKYLLNHQEKRITLAYRGMEISKRYSYDNTYLELTTYLGLKKR